MRVGHGYDVHRLVEGRDLIVGGVKIEYEKGLLGQSDADVLLHAVADALLGAASLGDIGGMFPDTDERFRGADSRVLLRQVVSAVKARGWIVGNIDATIIAQRPKMKPYIEQMAQNIADDCGVALDQVNVKATTEEGLGFTGTGEGIAAHAVCLLEGIERGQGTSGARWQPRRQHFWPGFPDAAPGIPVLHRMRLSAARMNRLTSLSRRPSTGRL